MTAYRFRVKFDPDPTSLWRDVVVGEDRTVDEFQTVINDAVGLDQGHLWFVGPGRGYWGSDVQFQCPAEFEVPDLDGPLVGDEEAYDAGETTVGEMADRLELATGDRICYLFDYGDEWRFYAILKEVVADEPDDGPPEVVDGEGEPVEQYGRPGGWK